MSNIQSNKITGIKSVDFKIHAKGHGVVNWNGPTAVSDEKGMERNGHSMPKLRGYTNKSGTFKVDSTYEYKKQAFDINLKETPLYISQNCIRHHLFKDHEFDLHFANNNNILDVLASATGLIRGYVIPNSQIKRASSFLMEDFVDQLGKGNFEQMGRSGPKKPKSDKAENEKDSSIFSKTTFGDTEYISYGSISIEQLQFISLDAKFGRNAIVLTDKNGELAATKITSYLQSLNTNQDRKPEATFHENYVRVGTILNEGEAGVLLNDDAIDIMVEHFIDRLENLTIRQSKAYMYVDQCEIDYNSGRMMRIKSNTSSCEQIKSGKYAIYFIAKDLKNSIHEVI